MSDLMPSIEEMTEIDEAITLGIPRALALEAAGISDDRMLKIQQAALAGTQPYKTWIAALKQAEAKAKVNHLKQLASSADWRARDKVLNLLDPSLLDGSAAEHSQTHDWMIRVISEEVDEETFQRILSRFASEGPGTQVESQEPEEQEEQLH